MKRVLLAGVGLVLAGCAETVSVAPAGVIQPKGTSIGVNLPQAWSLYPASINGFTSGAFLTQDGLLLNRVHMMSLKDGDALVRAGKKDDVPRYRNGATALEQVELVTDSLTLLLYSSLETSNVRPQAVGGAEGIRFDLTGKTSEGLNVRADVVAVEEGGALQLLIYIAPAEYYFDKNHADFDAMVSSATFTAG